MNDWIEWSGGECPVPKGTLVDAKHRDGCIYEKQEAGVRADAPNGYAEDWDFDGVSGDIIAYRLHQESVPLTTQLRTATIKRDKQAAKAARHAKKLQHREAEVERLKSELERKIEAETGLACTIGDRVGGIPDGVDVNDPKTWKEGDVVECVMVGCFSDHSPLPYTAGKKYVFDSLDKIMDPIIKENDYGQADSFYSDRLKFRFVRRPA